MDHSTAPVNFEKSHGSTWHLISKTVVDLDATYIPSANPEDQSPAKRLIIVGDVHGHLLELKNLLEKVKFDRDNGDHLIFVGDLVNKGPDSAGVVQLAMDLGASAVRGNNEDRVLAADAALKRDPNLKIEIKKPVEENASGEKVALAAEKIPTEPYNTQSLKRYSAEKDFATVALLSEEQISWLSSLPLILRIPLKGGLTPPWNAGTLLIAHAGLVPHLPLEEQDHWAVMNMRGLVYPNLGADVEEIRADVIKGVRSRIRRQIALHETTDEGIKAEWKKLDESLNEGRGYTGHYRDGLVGWPLESREGDWWCVAWSRAQNSFKAAEERSIVVYGHDAKIGLQVDPEMDIQIKTVEGGDTVRGQRYAFGLDSGCVYGNQLSAMVVERSPDGGLSHSIVQVDCIKEDK
ncbi:Metallophos domain-containing protein [Fusarium sp. LHS14.1]|nr:Metallophos domain-containing protein [Fusarium sp. LHS14.1]